MTEQRRLRGAGIGAGYFSQFHYQAWSRIGEVELVAVCDLDRQKAEDAAAAYGIDEVFTDVAAMLEAVQPDFVDITTRPESHLPLLESAARRGVSVICQKPMAPTWEECVAMVEVCEQAGVRLLIHENWRWQPWYREVKRIMDEGRLGKLMQLSFQWRTGDGRGPEPYVVQPYFRQMPKLLVYETLVHILDLFRYLAGEFASLYCRNERVNPAIVGEDQSLILANFECEALGLIDANRITGPVPAGVAMGSLVVEGDRGTLRSDPEGFLYFAEHGQPEAMLPFRPPASGYKGDSVLATQRHLIDCLRSGAAAESEGREYLKTVDAVFACYQSHATGRALALGQPRT
jgi:predicted dehydrogenase